MYLCIIWTKKRINDNSALKCQSNTFSLPTRHILTLGQDPSGDAFFEGFNMLTRKVLGILSLWLNYILGDNIAIIAYLHLHYMHLADAFIQSDLQCIMVIHFCQYMCSLGIEPTTFCAANAMLYHWATGTFMAYMLGCDFSMQTVTTVLFILH